MGIGFDLCTEATNTEVYGSLVYYGNERHPITPGGRSRLAHGIYIQNISGYKKVMDNIVFSNSGVGIHAYPHANDSSLLDVSVVGNILFNNGMLGDRPPRADLLVGGAAVAISPVVDGNATYKAAPGDLWNNRIGYSAGCTNPKITNNYLVGTTVFTRCTSGLTLTGNSFSEATLSQQAYGAATTALDVEAFPNNTYTRTRPTATRVFVRPNQYEAGRANITVYNWDLASTVSVDLSDVLSVGSVYQIRNAQDFFAAPVLTGTYDGNPVNIPMTGLSVTTPIGLRQPPPSAPRFNVFVLITTRFGRVPPESSPGTPNPPQTITPRDSATP